MAADVQRKLITELSITIRDQTLNKTKVCDMKKMENTTSYDLYKFEYNQEQNSYVQKTSHMSMMRLMVDEKNYYKVTTASLGVLFFTFFLFFEGLI